MNELISLGFASERVYSIVPARDYRPGVRVDWYGESGFFAISTSTRLDVSLKGPGLVRAGFPLVRDRGSFAVHYADEMEFLGKRRPAGEITTFPETDAGNLFGDIGAAFFSDGVLAFDPAGPYVAVADSWEPPASKHGFERLEHVGTSGLPLTKSLRFARAPDVEVAALLATTEPRSYVSSSIAAALTGRPSRPLKSGSREEVVLPGGQRVPVTVHVEDSMPTYAVDPGAEIGFVVGIDVLRRCISVFDFRAGCTWLRQYDPDQGGT